MGYYSHRISRLKTQLARVQAMLADLYDNGTESAAAGVDSYAFDSGEGSQRVNRRSIKDIMDTIERLEARENWLINELYAVGLINSQLRRKH